MINNNSTLNQSSLLNGLALSNPLNEREINRTKTNY